jgi:transposase InsO family protein
VQARPNARWSLDFVHDQFANGRRFRILNIVDDVTKECLGAIPETSISGRRVARELTAIVERRGSPSMIVSDNGTEFTCNAMLAWCKDASIDWHFTAPGKPMQNGFRRELQRTNARRAVERNPVLRSRRRPGQDHSLGPRLQFAATAFIPAIPYSDGLCRHPNRNGRSAAQP